MVPQCSLSSISTQGDIFISPKTRIRDNICSSKYFATFLLLFTLLYLSFSLKPLFPFSRNNKKSSNDNRLSKIKKIIMIHYITFSLVFPFIHHVYFSDRNMTYNLVLKIDAFDDQALTLAGTNNSGRPS